MVKPNGVARRLIGEIVARVERRGFTMRGMKRVRGTEQQAAEHYAEHVGKPFYPELVEFIASGPVVAMVSRGRSGRDRAGMMGATDPLESAPGTSAATSRSTRAENVVHGSDSPGSAAREIAIFFAEAELRG